MASILRNSNSATIAIHVGLFMIIVYFAEYAAGTFTPDYIVYSHTSEASCMKYGHSCWGAHGKRSSDNTNNKLRLPLSKVLSTSNDDAQNDVAQQWMLSQLNSRRAPVFSFDKERIDWNDFPKMNSIFSRRGSEETTATVLNDPIAVNAMNNNDNEEDSETILEPRNDYDDENNTLQRLNLFKLLNKSNKIF